MLNILIGHSIDERCLLQTDLSNLGTGCDRNNMLLNLKKFKTYKKKFNLYTFAYIDISLALLTKL